MILPRIPNLFFVAPAALRAGQVATLAVGNALATADMHKVIVVDLPCLNSAYGFEFTKGSPQKLAEFP